MQKIAVLDYGMGNLLSVRKAIEFVGAFPMITSNPAEICSADGIVLPGVGNFGDGIRNLCKMGLDSVIRNLINEGKPFLGICLGMQLLMEESEESPETSGLGIFKGKVLRFPRGELKVPHMGWNQMKIEKNHPCLDDIPDMSYFYFVHSYYVSAQDPEVILGTTFYGNEFASAIGRKNVFATQFHPEKSQDIGLQIIRNFIKLVHERR